MARAQGRASPHGKNERKGKRKGMGSDHPTQGQIPRYQMTSQYFYYLPTEPSWDQSFTTWAVGRYIGPTTADAVNRKIGHRKPDNCVLSLQLLCKSKTTLIN
jgi:hypothetical protein